MGIAIADAAADYGAEVELVLGPVPLIFCLKTARLKIINVTSAESMALRV